jgi:aminoglycoside 6'-N-acetyltransferase I
MSGAIRFTIIRCDQAHLEAWIALRHALWPDAMGERLRAEAAAILGRPDRAIALLARSQAGESLGFAEAILRTDYVNGCDTSPVAFLEGLYVRPDWQLRGVARRLCAAVETWAIRLGCTEFASDTDLANAGAQRAHIAMGFEETERVVYFRKTIGPAAIG